MSSRLTISEIRSATRDASIVSARTHVQIEEATEKTGRDGKPFLELKLRDASDAFTLRVWSDSTYYARYAALPARECVALDGDFTTSTYGLEARGWKILPLDAAAKIEFFAGSKEQQQAVQAAFECVQAHTSSIADPRLGALCQAFLAQHSTRFCRAAAARVNHHARRGGLIEHTAQMMRTAIAICDCYPQLNRDLLVAGVLFHDVGKLWETCPPEDGFAIAPERRGEMLGHICMGAEIINALWRELPRDEWKALNPPSEDVRLHLLHLVLSHHGDLEFGSPVVPKTPEAAALHYLDNLDARLEMFAGSYATSAEVAPGVYDRVRPLNANPVKPLPAYEASEVA